MAVLIGIFSFLALGMSDGAQEFSKHSAGSQAYEIVTPRACPTGLRETGYSWSVGGGIMLKEQNLDGTIGPVCNDEQGISDTLSFLKS